MLTIHSHTTAHHASAAATLALAPIVFGLTLLVRGVLTKVASHSRGRETTTPWILHNERRATAWIRIGTALFILGLAAELVRKILS